MFHANLKRRDKLPFAASMLGLAAASIGTAPFATAMKLVGKQGPNVMTALLIVCCAVLAWAVYRLTLPLVLRLLEQRREIILRAVTRE